MNLIKSTNLNRRSLLLASALPGTAIAQPAPTLNRGGKMVMIVNPQPATLAT